MIVCYQFPYCVGKDKDLLSLIIVNLFHPILGGAALGVRRSGFDVVIRRRDGSIFRPLLHFSAIATQVIHGLSTTHALAASLDSVSSTDLRDRTERTARREGGADSLPKTNQSAIDGDPVLLRQNRLECGFSLVGISG